MERGRSAEQQSHVANLNREFSRFCHFVGRSDCLREWPRDRSRYLQFTVYTELWQRNSIRTKRIGYGKTSANVNVHWRKKRINICIFVMLVRKRQKCDTKYIRNIEQTQECIFMLPVSIIVTIPYFFFFFFCQLPFSCYQCPNNFSNFPIVFLSIFRKKKEDYFITQLGINRFFFSGISFHYDETQRYDSACYFNFLE